MARRIAVQLLAALLMAGVIAPPTTASPVQKATKSHAALATCPPAKAKRRCPPGRRKAIFHATRGTSKRTHPRAPVGHSGTTQPAPTPPAPTAPLVSAPVPTLPAVPTTPITPPASITPPAPTGPPPSAGAVSGSLIVGLNASVEGWANMSARMSQVASQAGPAWIRQEFDWNQIEPQPGTFDFSRYDQFMLLTAQSGVHVLPIMLDVPSWAGATWNTIPADPTAYAAFVAAVVGRYGPHGSFWAQHASLAGYAIRTYELWNEPYYSNGNNGNYDPGAYARLVKAAAIAGRQADPDVHFLLAAENQAQLVGGTWVWWIDALYQAVPDLNNYFDGVAVHPYGTDFTSLSFPTPGVAYNGYEQVRRVEAIHQELAAHNAASKPLWITEIGWPTCTSGSDRCTTPAGQAADLTTVFSDARTSWSSYVQAVFVYSYDDSHPDSSNPENDYGLAYNNGTPKPALAVFKTEAAKS